MVKEIKDFIEEAKRKQLKVVNLTELRKEFKDKYSVLDICLSSEIDICANSEDLSKTRLFELAKDFNSTIYIEEVFLDYSSIVFKREFYDKYRHLIFKNFNSYGAYLKVAVKAFEKYVKPELKDAFVGYFKANVYDKKIEYTYMGEVYIKALKDYEEAVFG
jgi:hypothetical protein